MEAKEFGRFIAGMRKEKKMTQAELAEKIHVTDKAVSRWERGLGFPDIQTIEPLAQALGISVLELMRSERQEKAKEEAAPEIQYTQKEVAEMLQNAGDISRQQKKQDRNANVIAGFLVIGVAAAAGAAKIVKVVWWQQRLYRCGISSRTSMMKKAGKSMGQHPFCLSAFWHPW